MGFRLTKAPSYDEQGCLIGWYVLNGNVWVFEPLTPAIDDSV